MYPKKIKKWKRNHRENIICCFFRIYFIYLTIAIIITFIIFLTYKSKTSPELKIKINSISRTDAYNRGMDIINYIWDYDFAKNGSEKEGSIELPSYLKEKKSKKASGIPYCWGGYISVDISNQPDVENFRDAMIKGYTAGNVKSSGKYQYFTAGLDCSGFVSAVYKLPVKCSTKSFNQYFRKVSMKDLLPMDIINCEKNHVLIFLENTKDGKGIITMEESASKEKSVIGYRSFDEIKKGINGSPYIAMRYKGIVEDGFKPELDENEYNNSIQLSTLIYNKSINAGYIDYADDIDYFKLNSENKSGYEINVISMPENCIMDVTDKNGTVIAKIREKGCFKINPVTIQLYIKVYGVNFAYNNKERYCFTITKL
jgi:uncharacterized protein YraI